MNEKIPRDWRAVKTTETARKIFNCYFSDFYKKNEVTRKVFPNSTKHTESSVSTYFKIFKELRYLEGPENVKKKKFKASRLKLDTPIKDEREEVVKNCFRGNHKPFLDYILGNGVRLNKKEISLIKEMIIIFPEIRDVISKSEDVIEGFKNVLSSIIETPIARGLYTDFIADDPFGYIFSWESWKPLEPPYKANLTPALLKIYLKKVRKIIDEDYPLFISSPQTRKINKRSIKLGYKKVDVILSGIKRIYPIKFTNDLVRLILPEKFVDNFIRKYTLNKAFLKHT
jgi:hypothetical protein